MTGTPRRLQAPEPERDSSVLSEENQNPWSRSEVCSHAFCKSREEIYSESLSQALRSQAGVREEGGE